MSDAYSFACDAASNASVAETTDELLAAQALAIVAIALKLTEPQHDVVAVPSSEPPIEHRKDKVREDWRATLADARSLAQRGQVYDGNKFALHLLDILEAQASRADAAESALERLEALADSFLGTNTYAAVGNLILDKIRKK